MKTRFWVFAIGIPSILLFRVGVGIQQFYTKQEDGLGLKLALGGLGLTFLISGAIAFWKNNGLASFLFLLYCFGQAIHWGGPFRVVDEETQIAIWLVYFIVSMFGICALLHFSIVYCKPWEFVNKKRFLPVLYAPAVVGIILTLARFVLPLTSAKKPLVNIFILIEMVSVNLFALITIIIIVIRDVKADKETRIRFGLNLLVIGSILGPLPYIVAEFARVGSTQPYNLFFALTPILFSFAIVKSKT